MNTILENPRDAAIGIGFIVVGVPAFYYWSRKRNNGTIRKRLDWHVFVNIATRKYL